MPACDIDSHEYRRRKAERPLGARSGHGYHARRLIRVAPHDLIG